MSRNLMLRLLFSAMTATALGMLPGNASAHDDPVVTVRVLCNGINFLDLDAVLGEIADTAVLSLDRRVEGRDQIEAWAKDEMAHALRIQIVDLQPPEQSQAGYTMSWTARWSRDDWRKSGVTTRETSERVVISNGRITGWTSTIGVALADTPASAPVAEQGNRAAAVGRPTEVPSTSPSLTLVAAAVLLLTALGLVVRGLIRRGRA